MNTQLALVLALLAAAIVMFVVNKPRMDMVAVIMIVALPLTGTITMPEALAGFSDSNIVLIAALFVIGEGLVRTGVAQRLGDWMVKKAGSSQMRLLVLLMLVAGGLGSMMSSTAVVAIFIPIVLRISQNSGLPPGQLMMPLSMAALLSGMLTLVATAPNLVVSSELVQSGHAGFSFFAFTPFGLPLLFLGIGYMYFARRWLPKGDGSVAGNRPSHRSWVDQYRLGDRERRVRVRDFSPLVGKRLEELSLRPRGINLLAIERLRNFSTRVVRPTAKTTLRAGDILLMDALAPTVEAKALAEEFDVEVLPLSETSSYFADRTQEIGMVEVIIPAESNLVDRTVLQARVRAEYGLTVVGLRRGKQVYGHGMLNETLQIGDTLLLVGFWGDIRELRNDTSNVVVLNTPIEQDEVLPAMRRAPQAVGVLTLVIVLMVSGMVPNVQAALFGCLLMGLLKCVDIPSAYRAISWKTLVLIVGMLPFSLALQRTGGVDLAANALLAVIGGATPRLILASLFVITAALGLFISNTATAVLMAPVALAIAKDLGASPYPFAMTVALASSAAFMTPVSSPVNTMVVGPGNYSFGDFLKIGAPFTVIVLVVTVLLVPLILPL